MATVAGVLAVTSACTMKGQDAPPLTGPSEFGQSVTVSVSPDVLPQDGASQSLVTVTVRDANAQPVRNLTLRTETRVFGTPVDFGTLSSRSVVTGSDGRATLVYTAPPSPAVSVDPFLLVDVVVTPLGSNFDNSNQRSAAIRLVPQGPVIPQDDLVASFTFTPSAPFDNQPVLFDASLSRGTISEYQWDFGDDGRGSGRTASHAYDSPGTYIVTLTLVDPYGRTEKSSRSLTVTQSSVPTALFTTLPNPARVNTSVTFDGSASRPSADARIITYTWDFGDGTWTNTSTPTTSRVYSAVGSYQTRLFVTDSAGRVSAIFTGSVTITP